MYLLSQHPEALARLHREVHDLIGDHKAPTYEDIRGLKYMRAVLNGQPNP